MIRDTLLATIEVLLAKGGLSDAFIDILLDCVELLEQGQELQAIETLKQALCE